MLKHLMLFRNRLQVPANLWRVDLFYPNQIRAKTKRTYFGKSEQKVIESNLQGINHFWLIFLGLVIIVSTGCTNRGPLVVDQNTAESANNNDPLEKINRSIYKFNTKADKYLLKPAAKTYRAITPDPMEKGVSNFFDNLDEPTTVVNSVLQGKLGKAGTSAGRFVLNSTVGLLGIFDVADKLNIPASEEDFGQTLAVWGVPSGPYLVLPLFGPSNLRDTGGSVVDQFFDPEIFISDDDVRLALQVLEVLDTRAGFLDREDILELQLDPYVFVRESYRQRRQQEIEDAEGEDDDEFDDEFEQEQTEEIF